MTPGDFSHGALCRFYFFLMVSITVVFGLCTADSCIRWMSRTPQTVGVSKPYRMGQKLQGNAPSEGH